MPMLLSIAAGGALGALARHFVNRAALAWFGPGFPWGTLVVNVAGSLAMGLLIGWLARHDGISAEWRAFLTVGFLGALTTFSTFSLDAVALFERGQILTAGLYVVGSVVLSLGGLAAGLAFWRGAAV